MDPTRNKRTAGVVRASPPRRIYTSIDPTRFAHVLRGITYANAAKSNRGSFAEGEINFRPATFCRVFCSSRSLHRHDGSPQDRCVRRGSASSAANPATMSYRWPLAVLLFDGVARTDVGTMLRPTRAGGRYNFLATTTGRSILTSFFRRNLRRERICRVDGVYVNLRCISIALNFCRRMKVLLNATKFNVHTRISLIRL